MIQHYNGSMEEELSNVEDNSIDLLLTDPPYNISAKGAKPEWKDKDTGKSKNTIHSQKFSETFEEDWDNVSHEEFLASMCEWSKLWFPKLRKGGSFAIFISDRYISHLWHIMEETGFEPKRIFTWKKPAAVPFNRNINPVSGCEYFLWGIKPGGPRTFNSDTCNNSIIERYTAADKISSIVYRLVKDKLGVSSIDSIMAEAAKEATEMLSNRKTTDDIIHTVIPNTITYSGGLGNKIHPTQKPVELLEYIIELCTNHNDTVLDTFAGSGSTGKACENTGRKYILIEKDKKMYDKMCQQFNYGTFNELFV
jgi:site-specific DNA-methyltransferase (adenine-specific)